MSGDINVRVVPQSQAAQRLELAYRIIMAVYGLAVAWEVAKMLKPELSVHEDLIRERLAKRFSRRKKKVTQRQADDFVGQVTAYVRGTEDA